MTGTFPPWSPLNDPQLSAQVQAGLQSAQELARGTAQRSLYFLERYAWQEYPVKCGRWRRIEDPSALTSGTNMSGPWTKRTWTADFTLLLLLDPTTRQPIAAHTVNWPSQQVDRRIVFPVNSQTASVWFAGDPRVGGMFTPVGDGHSASFGHRLGANALGRWQGSQHYEQLAAAVAANPYAEPGGGSGGGSGTGSGSGSGGGGGDLGPWLVDQPQAPPSPKRFGVMPG